MTNKFLALSKTFCAVSFVYFMHGVLELKEGISERSEALNAYNETHYNHAASVPPGVLSLENTRKVIEFGSAHYMAERVKRWAEYDRFQEVISDVGNYPYDYATQLNETPYDIDFITNYVSERINSGYPEVHVGFVINPQDTANDSDEQLRVVREAAKDVVREYQEEGASFTGFFALQPTRGLEPGTIVYFMGDKNGIFVDDLEYFKIIFGKSFEDKIHVYSTAQLEDRANTPNYIPIL